MLQTGIQLHLPTYNAMSLADLVCMGQLAHSGGIDQVWVTDNLQSRNAFVVLAALASAVPARLGTAVLVHYFRSPVDVADAVATLTEMMDGRELTLAVSRGNPSTHRLVHTTKPVTMLRETATVLRALLEGGSVEFRDFPALAEYFNFVPDRTYRLSFKPGSRVPLYGGGNAPLSLAVAGELMDGVMWGWSFPAAARSGRLRELIGVADEAAASRGVEPLHKVAELKIYIDPDHAKARAFCRHHVASRILGLRGLGYTAEHFENMGVATGDVDRLYQASAAGASTDELSDLFTDAMLDAMFVAGDVVFCRERMMQIASLAREHGFEQIMFSEMGPDAPLATRLLCEQILPTL